MCKDTDTLAFGMHWWRMSMGEQYDYMCDWRVYTNNINNAFVECFKALHKSCTLQWGANFTNQHQLCCSLPSWQLWIIWVKHIREWEVTSFWVSHWWSLLDLLANSGELSMSGYWMENNMQPYHLGLESEKKLGLKVFKPTMYASSVCWLGCI